MRSDESKDMQKIKEENKKNNPFKDVLIENLDTNAHFSNNPQGNLLIYILESKVLFPGLMLHLSFDKSQKLIADTIKKLHLLGKPLGIILRKNIENCSAKEIYEYGTIAEIIDIRKSGRDDKIHLVLRGKNKFKIENSQKDFTLNGDSLISKVNIINESNIELNAEDIVLVESLKDYTLELLKKDPEFPVHAEEMINGNLGTPFLVYFATSITSANKYEEQTILSEENLIKKVKMALNHVLSDIEIWKLRQSVKSKVYKGISDQQKEIYIRKEIAALKNEIGEGDDVIDDIQVLINKAKNKKWSKTAQIHFENNIQKLQRTSSSSPEYSAYMNHTEFFVDLPWQKYTKDVFDIEKAKKILDKKHFGMEKVKERILEYLAVIKLKGTIKNSPILCLCGPPGVGKTSLGKYIAKAIGRKYVRISLGAVSDESDIRGHKKTYIGAMPGKIISQLKLAQTSNPVFVLDEIDKMYSHKGSPEAALLELFDPEQNENFTDNFVEIPYDMSKVIFIATANNIDNISYPLRDRMEILNIEGYSTEEKISIAKKYIMPDQLNEHGLKSDDLKINVKAMEKIIDEYTWEPGLRQLKKTLAKMNRKVAKYKVLGKDYEKNINEKNITNLLGVESYYKDIYEKQKHAGIAVGLAYTPYGGEIMYIESTATQGKGEVIISGQLGEVMKESAMAAISYLKTQSKKLKLDNRIFDKYDLHIHIPDGATPKDGPSAGITLATALASLYTQRKIVDKISMSGEITLRGRVLPVGGIKEKILAAKRAGIKKVILSNKNKKDVEEIESSYIKNIAFQYVETMEEVLDIALQKQRLKNGMKWEVK